MANNNVILETVDISEDQISEWLNEFDLALESGNYEIIDPILVGKSIKTKKHGRC